MNKESLIAKRATVEARFIELQKEQAKVNEELLRLLGEYRSLNALIDEIKPNEVIKKAKE